MVTFGREKTGDIVLLSTILDFEKEEAGEQKTSSVSNVFLIVAEENADDRNRLRSGKAVYICSRRMAHVICGLSPRPFEST